jgi:hypothetical protein
VSKAFTSIDRYFLGIQGSVCAAHPEIFNKWGVDELETLWRVKFGRVCRTYLPESVVADFGQYGSDGHARVTHIGEDLFWLAVSLRLFSEKKLARMDTHEVVGARVQITFKIYEG